MSEKHRKDNLRNPRELPTAADRAKTKGPPKTHDRGLELFARCALFVGVGAILLIIALILVPRIAPETLSSLGGFLDAYRSELEVLVLIATGLTVFSVTLTFRRSRESGEIQVQEAPATKVEPQPEPVSRTQEAPRAQAKPKGITCRVCGPKSPIFKTWPDLFVHLEEHGEELRVTFEEFPDKESAKALIESWFSEEN